MESVKATNPEQLPKTEVKIESKKEPADLEQLPKTEVKMESKTEPADPEELA